MLTFIDGEPLKAGMLLRGATVLPSILFTATYSCEIKLIYNKYM